MHIAKSKRSDALCGVLALGLGLLIGYVDLHVKEVQLPALLMIAGGCFLGFARPFQAWRRALPLGLGIPLAHLFGRVLGHSPPYPVPGFLELTIITQVPAFIGVYLGALTARLIAHLRDQNS